MKAQQHAAPGSRSQELNAFSSIEARPVTTAGQADLGQGSYIILL